MLWHSITSSNFGYVHLRAIEIALLGFVLSLETQRGEVACSRPGIVAVPERRHAVWEGWKKEMQVQRNWDNERLCWMTTDHTWALKRVDYKQSVVPLEKLKTCTELDVSSGQWRRVVLYTCTKHSEKPTTQSTLKIEDAVKLIPLQA
jgi:hypothetical protein